jgi:hypothetical protein
MRLIESFNRFLAEEVDLNPVRLQRLNRSTTAVTEFLSQNLNGYRTQERKGSYAQRTIIRPAAGSTYDADILVFMEHIPGKKPRDYIDELHACLSSNADLANKLRKKTRCVAVGYADGFSIDFVPCKVRGGRRYICDSELDQFEPTDGTGYQEWLNGKADITNGHLKGAVRLLKHLRDHKGNF